MRQAVSIWSAFPLALYLNCSFEITFELNISKDNKDSIYESSDNKQYVFTYEMLNKREYVNLSGYVWKEAVYALKEGNIRDEI